jgi:hypothetical protein
LRNSIFLWVKVQNNFFADIESVKLSLQKYSYTIIELLKLTLKPSWFHACLSFLNCIIFF